MRAAALAALPAILAVALAVPLDTVARVPDEVLETTVGGTVTVDLESNPSTGYHWELVGIDQQTAVLEQQGEPVYEPDVQESDMVLGAGGTTSWTFLGLSAGTAEVTMGYFPPGAGVGSEPEETRLFLVTVR